MTTSSPEPRRRRRPREAPDESKQEELARLRRLLVGPEQSRLDAVEQGLSPEALGKVLPEAAVLSQERGDALGWALRPAVVAAIRDAADKDPRLFVDAIAPVMGPAIRKAVSQALRSLVQQLNETLARGLSPRALSWRFEALRTGRPFAEIVMLRSLLYRVEQVFLVHAPTGLVLKHMVLPGSPAQDPDQVAAMLSAIDAFAHDAFREDAPLAHFEVGELSGWVEHGPLAVVVAVLRGTAPARLGEVLREAGERIHLEYRRELSEFQGDVAPFEGTASILESCFLTETVRARAPARRRRAAWGFAAFALFLAAVVGVASWRAHRSAERFQRYEEALRREPGLVLTRSERHGDRFEFEGLRDPLAREPSALLAAAGMDRAGATLRFSPFLSLDPRIAERRATAPYDTDADRGLRALADALAERRILFAPSSAELGDESRGELERAIDDVRKLADWAEASGAAVRVDVVGHADSRGPDELNRVLSVARASRVAEAVTGALAEDARRVIGVRAQGEGGVHFPDTWRCVRTRHRGADCARAVSFRVRLEPDVRP